MKSLPTEIIIDGIRKQDKQILRAIYYTYFPNIKKMVLDNKGDEQDAKDVFQEGLIVVYRKIKEGNLNISSTFKRYIYGICRFIWLHELSETKENSENLTVCLEYDNIPDIKFDEYKKHKQFELYQKHFKKLGKSCRKILKLFLKNVPLVEIAKKIGTSPEFVRKKKFLCKEQLMTNIKKDPEYAKWK